MTEQEETIKDLKKELKDTQNEAMGWKQAYNSIKQSRDNMIDIDKYTTKPEPFLIESLKAVKAKEIFELDGLELGEDIRAFTFEN